MVAEPLPTLSDAAPAPRARLGDRLWHGLSGESYLFSAVPFEAIADFRSSVALLAEPTGDGRFLAWAAASIDASGQVDSPDGAWPGAAPRGSVAFVHFLAATERERLVLIEDIFGPAEAESFSLAA